jgi:hypothetical protein
MGQLELLLLLTAVENTTRGQPCTAAAPPRSLTSTLQDFILYLPL